jgi:hypothetical protein
VLVFSWLRVSEQENTGKPMCRPWSGGTRTSRDVSLCLLVAPIFAAIGLGVAFSGKSIAGPFADAEGVVSAALGYFYAKGQVYGFMAAFDTVFHQGWGQATAPLVASL